MLEEYGVVHARDQFAAAKPPIDPSAVFAALQDAGVTELYPDFRGWFFGKVVPGLRTGERCITPAIIDSNLAGVAICKRTRTERKLSTLWVRGEVRNRRIAAQLAHDAFAWLGTSQPLFTMPEERAPEFSRLMKAWSFPKAIAYRGLYRSGRVEYVFNGPIDGSAH